MQILCDVSVLEPVLLMHNFITRKLDKTGRIEFFGIHKRQLCRTRRCQEREAEVEIVTVYNSPTLLSFLRKMFVRLRSFGQDFRSLIPRTLLNIRGANGSIITDVENHSLQHEANYTMYDTKSMMYSEDQALSQSSRVVNGISSIDQFGYSEFRWHREYGLMSEATN